MLPQPAADASRYTPPMRGNDGQGRPRDGFVTVMGLGRFGGGAGVARWLCERGERVLLTDLDDRTKLAGPLATLADLLVGGEGEGEPTPGRIVLRLGRHETTDFARAKAVVANVAVPTPERNPFLAAARDAGVPIQTEIRLTVEALEARGVRRIVGVTGSAGKSTTASLLRHLLEAPGRRASLGGNIGGSLLGGIDRLGPDDFVVLELSSAMLHWLRPDAGFPGQAGWSPPIGVLTNLAPNHLDWHGSLADYLEAKSRIRGGRFVSRFARESPEVAASLAAGHRDWWSRDARDGEPLRFDPARLPLALPGEHNRRNATLALVAAMEALDAAGERADPDALVARVASFRGLPHRLELVLERDGLRCYNDSKSTTPDATLRAIASFPDPARIHLIAGGYDKGSDLSPLRDLAPRLGRLYAIGQTAPNLLGPNASDCRDLETAVAEAAGRIASAGGEGILLLSPGCASWGTFTNFEERGERFRSLVATVFGGDAAAPREAALGA